MLHWAVVFGVSTIVAVAVGFAGKGEPMVIIWEVAFIASAVMAGDFGLAKNISK